MQKIGTGRSPFATASGSDHEGVGVGEGGDGDGGEGEDEGGDEGGDEEKVEDGEKDIGYGNEGGYLWEGEDVFMNEDEISYGTSGRSAAPSPPRTPSPQENLQGASRTIGGHMRGQAFGNQPNMADISKYCLILENY